MHSYAPYSYDTVMPGERVRYSEALQLVGVRLKVAGWKVGLLKLRHIAIKVIAIQVIAI